MARPVGESGNGACCSNFLGSGALGSVGSATCGDSLLGAPGTVPDGWTSTREASTTASTIFFTGPGLSSISPPTLERTLAGAIHRTGAHRLLPMPHERLSRPAVISPVRHTRSRQGAASPPRLRPSQQAGGRTFGRSVSLGLVWLLARMALKGGTAGPVLHVLLVLPDALDTVVVLLVDLVVQV
ncbi:hypothetical protein GCM10009665_37510 [Kitasatospora nipponensis]|uniref:Uncharacterized protein n=1 Tax=Kitasatospora nipponensis TaxID=258049 RepID=A0ABN1WAT5_9ACTN